MDAFKLREKLGTLVGTPKLVKLARFLQTEYVHSGRVINLGRDWVLLYQFNDFQAGGYIALRISDIKRFKSGKSERFYEQILASEGLLDIAKMPQDLPVDDVASLLRALQGRKQNIIVECEESPQEVWEFSIGQILLVEDDTLYFAHFDGMGRWIDTPFAIPLSEITSIEFETPYVQTFSKYVSGPCPHLRPHAT